MSIYGRIRSFLARRKAEKAVSNLLNQIAPSIERQKRKRPTITIEPPPQFPIKSFISGRK